MKKSALLFLFTNEEALNAKDSNSHCKQNQVTTKNILDNLCISDAE